jgi:biotin carboxylase
MPSDAADTLILTCAGGRMMPLLVRWIRHTRPGRRILGVDTNPSVAAKGVPGFERVITVPSPDAPDYVEALAALLVQSGPAVIVPGSDEEALRLAGEQHALRAAGGHIASATANDLAAASDKLALPQALEAANLAAIPVLRAPDPERAREAILSLGGPARPVVLKPSRGRGRRGVYIVSDREMPEHEDLPPRITMDRLAEAYAGVPRPDMAMPYVSGSALTVDVLADHGAPIAIVVRDWLATWRFPFPGQRVVRDEIVERMAIAVARHFNLHGLIDIDMIRPSDGGPPVLLEINPRPSGSAVVALAAGVPLFDLVAELACGRPPATPHVAEREIQLADLENV